MLSVPEKALLVMVAKSDIMKMNSVNSAFAVLAPQLDQSQVNRAGDALIAMLEKSKDDNVRRSALLGLEALAPRLDHSQVERSGNALISSLGKSTQELIDGNSALKRSHREWKQRRQSARGMP